MNKANAEKLLFAVADVLESHGAEFFLYGGTFLGAVRDGDFIDCDRDIDLGILLENLAPVVHGIVEDLRYMGIRAEIVDHRHKASWDDGVYAIKFRAFGEHGDLAGFKAVKGLRVIPSHARLFWLTHKPENVEELGWIEFRGRMFRCPLYADEFLTEKYDDWRTPHTEFGNISKPTCRLTEDQMTEFLK